MRTQHARSIRCEGIKRSRATRYMTGSGGWHASCSPKYIVHSHFSALGRTAICEPSRQLNSPIYACPIWWAHIREHITYISARTACRPVVLMEVIFRRMAVRYEDCQRAGAHAGRYRNVAYILMSARIVFLYGSRESNVSCWSHATTLCLNQAKSGVYLYVWEHL